MVTEFYYPHLGGVCEHVHFLSAELRRRGWEVDIITGAINGARDDPHVIRLGRSVSVYANGSHARITVGRRLRQRVRALLRKGGYDLVHVHGPLAPTLPMLALEEAECPVVGTFHTPLGRHLAYELAGGYFQRLVDRLAAAIAVSPAAASGYERYFDAPWEIIPNGIDPDEFREDVPCPPAMADGDGRPRILFLGRLDPRNGLGTMLEAHSRLRATLPRPPRTVVVGGGLLRRYYELRAFGRGDVRFVGPILAGRAGYYAHADVYVCPTTRGTFGITLLEALACGTPVVCSDLPAFGHVVRDGKEGILAGMGDADKLADGIRAVLSDPELRNRLRTAARARALEFSWRRVTDEVLSVYGRVSGNRERCEPSADVEPEGER